MPTIHMTMMKSDDQRHHARGEHFLQHVDIGGHARHQPAHRIAVEVTHRQLLHMGKNRHPQIGQTALRHQHGEIVLGEHRHGLADQRGQETAA